MEATAGARNAEEVTNKAEAAEVFFNFPTTNDLNNTVPPLLIS